MDHDDTPRTTPHLPEKLNIYRKDTYENDQRMCVIYRDCINGNYTEDITPFMGVAMLQMAFEGGQQQQIMREFPLPFATIEECFKNFMETLQKSIPIIQEKIKQEMIAAQKQQSRIITAQKKFNFGAPDSSHGR